MKTRVFRVLSLLIGLALLLALLLTLGASAQERQPTGRPMVAAPHPNSRLVQLGPDGEPLRPMGGAARPPAASVPVGQPGLSFRYVENLGETMVPYLADTEHVNFPFGVWAGSGDVWIGESFGRRALQYTESGSFLSAIGTAGVAQNGDQWIWWLSDVAVDGAGNTWLADADGNHLLEYDSNGAFLRELGGGWGDDDYHFGYAAGLAFDSAGNLYVSDGVEWWSGDVGNQRIQIYDPDGDYLNTIGQTGVPGQGNDQFYGPCHIAIYADVLYVADSRNHRVQLFDVSNPSTPAYLATIGVTGEPGDDSTHLDTPMGVAVDASSIYVADSANNRVQIFSRATRAYQGTIGTGWGTGDYEFKLPTDVAVDGSLLYVADFVNSRVQQFDAGAYQRTYGVTGVPYLTDGSHYNSPAGVDVGPDGSLYLVEDNGHRLLKLSSDGALQWAVGAAGVKGDWDYSNDLLNNPTDVALDAAGRIYVADLWHGRVQIYNASGSYFSTVDDWAGGDLWCPRGLTVAPDGYLYVADPCRQQVVVFDAVWAYVAALGVVGEAGSDNDHFSGPNDVAVDGDGTIYVADTDNQRVQVFDPNRVYLRTMGVTGEAGSDFGHFSWPSHLDLDAADRLYVSDPGNARVQVFDGGGAYLTTVGGSWGTNSGQMKSPEGVAVDGEGNLYVAEWENDRVQVFSPGYPGWVQTNINGFGDPRQSIGTLTVFNSYLYAGTWGNQVWRAPDGHTWTEVTPTWSPSGMTVFDSEVFGSHLYLGTSPWDDSGGEVWRTDGNTWQQVASTGFGDATNYGVNALHVFSGALYAATSNQTTGVEVWRSFTGNPGDWTQVNVDSFGGVPVTTTQDLVMDEYGGRLYVGIGRYDPSWNSTAELWRTDDGTTWVPVFTDGLAPNNTMVSALAEFGGYLYVGLRNVTTGGEVWRSADGLNWQPVITGGLGDPDNQRPYGLIAYGGKLYLVFCNRVTGSEVWRSANGTDWDQVADAGWGNSQPGSAFADYFDKAAAVYADRLYIGTFAGGGGGRIWKRTVTADFTASPTEGTPPLTVQFTNTSGGDYATSLWDFGDGTTSTETNPSHTYAAGVYDVSLTVGDGVDTSTITRAAYVRAMHSVYLPLVMRNY